MLTQALAMTGEGIKKYRGGQHQRRDAERQEGAQHIVPGPQADRADNNRADQAPIARPQ